MNRSIPTYRSWGEGLINPIILLNYYYRELSIKSNYFRRMVYSDFGFYTMCNHDELDYEFDEDEIPLSELLAFNISDQEKKGTGLEGDTMDRPINLKNGNGRSQNGSDSGIGAELSDDFLSLSSSSSGSPGDGSAGVKEPKQLIDPTFTYFVESAFSGTGDTYEGIPRKFSSADPLGLFQDDKGLDLTIKNGFCEPLQVTLGKTEMQSTLVNSITFGSNKDSPGTAMTLQFWAGNDDTSDGSCSESEERKTAVELPAPREVPKQEEEEEKVGVELGKEDEEVEEVNERLEEKKDEGARSPVPTLKIKKSYTVYSYVKKTVTPKAKEPPVRLKLFKTGPGPDMWGSEVVGEGSNGKKKHRKRDAPNKGILDDLSDCSTSSKMPKLDKYEPVKLDEADSEYSNVGSPPNLDCYDECM